MTLTSRSSWMVIIKYCSCIIQSSTLLVLVLYCLLHIPFTPCMSLMPTKYIPLAHRRALKGNAKQILKQPAHWCQSLKHDCPFIHPPLSCPAGHPLPFCPSLWHNAQAFICGLCSKYNTGYCLGAQEVLSGKATWFQDFWYIYT